MQGVTLAGLGVTQPFSFCSSNRTWRLQDKRATFVGARTACLVESSTCKKRSGCNAEARRGATRATGGFRQPESSIDNVSEHLDLVQPLCTRRHMAALLASGLSLPRLSGDTATADTLPLEDKQQFTDMPALRGKDYGKTRIKYPDYVETTTGLQYKDLREGSGPPAKKGDSVVIDWDGFTIGYYGRIFEARNKAKGGSFEGSEKDYYRFRLGVDKVIPAFEEAIQGMQVGGVRRIIVPPELGYPDNDYRKAGPAPITFSGQRALSFVLENKGLIDKTLLFDIELLRVTPME